VARQAVAPGQRVVVGRAKEATICVLDSELSRQHAAVDRTAEGWFVTDLGSSNGTFLDGQRLPPHQPARFGPGLVVRLGSHRIEVGPPAPAVDPRVAAAAARVGPLLPPDRFEVVREIGQGAAGKVFAARTKPEGRPVAVKVLLDKVSSDPALRQRFLREAQVCTRVDSPYVVKVFEVLVYQDRPLIVMEWVEGSSAAAWLETGIPPLPWALGVTEHAARGLADAHAVSVVHRDVKPGNIFVTQAGSAKVGDFGIAKDTAAQTILTKTGVGMGTMSYVAPEQVLDSKRVTPAADVYSLGATFYQFLSGRPPLIGEGPRFLDKILDDDPEDVRHHRRDCPAEVAKLVHWMLEKDLDDRPPMKHVVKKLVELRAKLPG
jgi:serine/threonine-protein kinase